MTDLRARLLYDDFGSRNVMLEYIPNTLNKISLNLLLAAPGKLADYNNLQYKKYIIYLYRTLKQTKQDYKPKCV